MKKNKVGNNDLIYLYNGDRINKELKFKEQANEIDKTRMKMDILVIKIEDDSDGIKKLASNDIICPTCNENILIDIKDYKINLNDCKNNHNKENILLNKYEETQKIKLNDIKCNICEINNKSNTYNNEFFICNTCNKNICPLCKSKHDKGHFIINYDDKNYICKKHNEPFNTYCKTCKEDLCIICKREHKDHDLVDLSEIILNKNELIKIKQDLKNVIDKFKYKMNIIKEILDKMGNIIDTYYKINNNIIDNYNMNKRNYYVLLNINYIKNNNEKLIEELNNIIKEDKIYEYSLNNFYNEIGEKYIGHLNNGVKDGKGIIYYSKNDIAKRYEGDWKNGKKEGKGTVHFKNGDKYEGDWKNDIREGKGIYFFNNGDKYEGDFKNNILDEKGIYYFNGGNKYEGDFKNDDLEGKGIYYFQGKKKEEGEWQNGQLKKKVYLMFGSSKD